MPPKFQRWKGIMKAYPFEEKRLAKWQPPYIVQPKYDGVRCRAVPLENGEFILLSSEENVIYSVPHINKALNHQLPKLEWDGELYAHHLSFEEIVSRTSRTVNFHSDYEAIQFHIFDYVDEICLQAQRASRIIDVKMTEPLIKAPIWIADNLDEIMKVYDNLLSSDYEGIIVRNFTAPYERKRSTWVMKFKPKKEDEYVITGYQEEVSIEGRPKDTLGSLWCESGDGNSFSVGTGFTDDERARLWDIRSEIVGKVVKIQYQHLTSGKKVPRFPVFVEVVEND